MIYSPNPDSAANTQLGEYYNDWPEGYNQFMRDQAKLLADADADED